MKITKRQAIVNNDVPLRLLLSTLFGGGRSPYSTAAPFGRMLATFFGARRCRLTSCGFAALSVILDALRGQHPDRTEVVIPAYTAPGLVLPVRKLGLKAVLCDVEHRGFLMDIVRLGPLLGPRTLAVIPVHMFGLPCDTAAFMRLAGKDITVIEDCAQALGTEVNGRKAGSISPYAFGSFGRGKNFSLYHGGFLTVNEGADEEYITASAARLPDEKRLAAVRALLKFAAFSAATEPSIYVKTAGLLGRLKSRRELTAFESAELAPLVATVASPLFNLWLRSYQTRIKNGAYLHAALKDIPGLVVPAYPANARIAYNRFPLIVENAAAVAGIIATLHAQGIEASRMYERPVHHAFDLGYPAGDLSESVYLAEHLLTLPVHGNMAHEDLDRIISVMKGAAS
jgi:dTDP-4-amino-4,6-dideoxygalactose transaminase